MLSEYNAAVAQYGCPRSLPQPPDIPPLIEAYYGCPAATVEIAEFVPVCTSRSNETATVAVRYACTESTPCKDDIVAALIDLRCLIGKNTWIVESTSIVADISAIPTSINCSVCLNPERRDTLYSDSPPGSLAYTSESHCLGKK